MRIWEITTEFPHRTVLSLGVMILSGGVVLLILGTVDVTKTAVLYTSQYNRCPTGWPTALQNPCDHGNLVWTWVSAAIWGGFLIILVGILSIMLNGTRTVDKLKFARDMFLVGCILLAFPLCPVVLVCIGLEIGYDRGVFFYDTDSGSLQIADHAKFVIPVINLVITAIVWLLACVAIVIMCLRRLNITKKLVVNKSPKLLIPEVKPANQIVAIVPPTPVTQIVAPPTPLVIQQQQPQYEVSIIQSPAPKPYYVTAPHPDSAMVDVMNRMNHQRGPNIGPMYGPYSPQMLGLEPVPPTPPLYGPPIGPPPGYGPPLPPAFFGPPITGPATEGSVMYGPAIGGPYV